VTLTPVWSSRFKRDIRKAEKRGKDVRKIKNVLALLVEQAPLPAGYKDHPPERRLEGLTRPSHRTRLAAALSD
jgi:addiction module RelE/StbE family toxin